jgi:PAS domain S-box-containing protein
MKAASGKKGEENGDNCSVLRQLFDNMESGVAIYDAVGEGKDFVFKDMNKAGEEFSKVRIENIRGKSIMGVFPGAGKMGLFKAMQDVWRTGKPVRLPLFRYEDKRITQWVKNYVFRLPSGEIVAIYEDLTEHEKIHEDIRKSEETFRSIFDGVNDGVFIHDPNTGMILKVNRKACEMFGFTQEQATKLTVGDISSGEPGFTLKDAVGWVKKAAGKPQIFEWKSKSLKGDIFWTEVSLKKAVIGGEENVMAVVRDIRERKLAEAVARKRAEELEKFNSMSVGRELRMVELKKRVGELEKLLKKNGVEVPPEEKSAAAGS